MRCGLRRGWSSGVGSKSPSPTTDRVFRPGLSKRFSRRQGPPGEAGRKADWVLACICAGSWSSGHSAGGSGSRRATAKALPSDSQFRRGFGPDPALGLPMSEPTPMWVRVGGGLESVPDHLRHGPADLEFPPPGGPWEPLLLSGRLVGWAEKGGLRLARQSAEIGQRLAHEQRDYLLGRLGHKLRSSVLA